MDMKLSDLLGSPAYPGEMPETAERAEQHRRDYSVAPERDPDEYNFVMTPTHVSVAPGPHGELFSTMGVNDDRRPHAFGSLILHYLWDAVWQVEYSNMSLHLVEKKLRKYTKDQGWKWAGLMDEHGSPLTKTGSVVKVGQATMYHVSWTDGRDDILKNGINWRRGSVAIFPGDEHPPANFLWESLADAQDYRDYQQWQDDMDIWEVGVDGLDLAPGPYARGEFYTEDPIAPWRLRLHYQGRRVASVPGIGEINPGVKDWRNKEWSGTEMFDNPGHEMSETPYYGFDDPEEDFPMTAPRTCSECGELMLDYNDWREHILRKHVNPDRRPPRDPQPVVDLDDVLPANFNEAIMDKTVQRQSRLIWQLAAGGATMEALPDLNYVLDHNPEDELDKGWWAYIQNFKSGELFASSAQGIPWEEAKEFLWDHAEDWLRAKLDVAIPNQPFEYLADDKLRPMALWVIEKIESWRQSKISAKGPTIPGPMPFIYDIETDRIFVGHPGERHSDISGRFTPGGIIEGIYDPKGSVQIRTDTDMPYTVRHMIELWYALHPELEVKSVYLLVGEKRYKLASANIAHKIRNLVATDPAAWAAYKALEPLGNVYVVGGAIRDVVLNKTPKDIDLLVQGVEPEDVREALELLPGRVDYTGQQFGVFRYRDRDGNEVEVALPRTERSTGAGHKDFEVFTSPYLSVGEDLARRDFTGNAMAVNLTTGDLIDPYRGSEDLKSGILKTVSDRSFPEDPLRILRALTAISRHQLDPSPELYHQMAAHAADLKELPHERIMMELDKMMGGKDPAKSIVFAEATGVLEHILPEVAATIGFDQKNKYHNLLLNDHLREVLSRAALRSDDLDVRWAALLHDIGKPGSQWFDDEGWAHYYEGEEGQGFDHEHVGADMTRAALERLKFPTDRIDRIEHLVRNHMFPYFETEKGARKFLNKVGDEHAEPLMMLRDADSGGKGYEWDGNVNMMRQLIQRVQETQQPTKLSQLAINGNDLIEAGIKPGPQMGQILRYLTNAVIEDPALNERGTLLEMALATIDDPNLLIVPEEKHGSWKLANILDPIRDGLDPNVFNNAESPIPAVKPKIIEWVTKKIYKTLIKAGWPDPAELDYLKMILTGSLTTYQWSETSDFDVSLWIVTENLPEWVRADLIAMMVEACDGVIVPGTTHPLQVFVVDSRRYQPSDLYKPGERSAYDLNKREWYVLPEKHRVQDVYQNYPATIAYAKGCEDKIRMLLRYDKYALETYWDFLHHQRARAMQNGEGDYSEANIVYKWIVNAGLVPHISEAIGRYLAL